MIDRNRLVVSTSSDGVDKFFITFLQVLKERKATNMEVEPGVTSGDFLFGFLLGTRRALGDAGHPSITLTLDRFDTRHLGALIALFERAVGLYASRIGVNAYHQPGVEAGKRAATDVLSIRARLLVLLGDDPQTASALAEALGTADADVVWYLLNRLAINEHGVDRIVGMRPRDDKFFRIVG